MKKTTTAERLKQILKERSLRQVDILDLCKPLCEKFGIKLAKNDLSQYISGKVQPGQDKLSILGLALNISEAWLMGYDVPQSRSPDSSSPLPSNIRPVTLKRFPLLGEIACGTPIFASEDHETYIDASADIKADFCLVAKGDSMTGARINNGDVVFIREQPTVENGEIAAVIIGDEATLKRWYFYPEKQKLMLTPENPAFEPLVYIGPELNEVRCLGKAVSFMSKL